MQAINQAILNGLLRVAMNKKVVADAKSQALKWQGIIVLEKVKVLLCKSGWQHGYIRPIEYSVFFILNKEKCYARQKNSNKNVSSRK